MPAVRATPFYCWVDFDPYGFDILLNYRYASKMRQQEQIGCPELRWLGVHASEVVQPGVHNRAIPLTNEDLQKLDKLIDSHKALRTTGELSNWRGELVWMREWRLKAELEAVLELCDHDANQLVVYLQHRMAMLSGRW